MSKLTDLLTAVKDENLTLLQIEKYRDELVHLHSAMQLELANIERAEAMFFADEVWDIPVNGKTATDVSIKRAWRATEKGQRGIELNRFVKAVAKEIDSLKSRVYRLI
jgi:hypothetical protein